MVCGGRSGAAGASREEKAEMVNLRAAYLKRVEELVRFDVLAKAKSKFVVDVLLGAARGISIRC